MKKLGNFVKDLKKYEFDWIRFEDGKEMKMSFLFL